MQRLRLTYRYPQHNTPLHFKEPMSSHRVTTLLPSMQTAGPVPSFPLACIQPPNQPNPTRCPHAPKQCKTSEQPYLPLSKKRKPSSFFSIPQSKANNMIHHAMPCLFFCFSALLFPTSPSPIPKFSKSTQAQRGLSAPSSILLPPRHATPRHATPRHATHQLHCGTYWGRSRICDGVHAHVHVQVSHPLNTLAHSNYRPDRRLAGIRSLNPARR